jgi:hypothetical protein
MRKGAARNMQRISLKVVAGTAPPQNRDVHQAPVYKQVRALELRRLARVRYSFEIEQEIAEKMAAGESVGLLREKLLGVRNGTIEPPHYKGLRPTGDSIRLSRKARAAEQRKHDNRRAPPEKRLYRSERELESDLADLAKGKLTPTGIGTIKGMLERFDEELVIAVLGLPQDFVRKVAASAVYRLAPDLSPKDGLLLSEVLQTRLPADEEAAPPPKSAAATEAKAVPERVSRPAPAPSGPPAGAISVDDISGAEFLNLRSKGWGIKGAWMYPPGVDPASAPAAAAAKKKVVVPSPVKARVAVAPKTAKPSKSPKKVKTAKKDPAARGQRHVPLSQEALDRLRSNDAFKTTPLATPGKNGTLSLPDRPGFVTPPASEKINWRDETEDGSMWDR